MNDGENAKGTGGRQGDPPGSPEGAQPVHQLISEVKAMGEHRAGRLTLKTRSVEPIRSRPIAPDVVREMREALKMSRHVFAFKIGVNPRTLERWEQGRKQAERPDRGLDLAGQDGSGHP